eukprot:UN12977
MFLTFPSMELINLTVSSVEEHAMKFPLLEKSNPLTTPLSWLCIFATANCFMLWLFKIICLLSFTDDL